MGDKDSGKTMGRQLVRGTDDYNDLGAAIVLLFAIRGCVFDQYMQVYTMHMKICALAGVNFHSAKMLWCGMVWPTLEKQDGYMDLLQKDKDKAEKPSGGADGLIH